MLGVSTRCIRKRLSRYLKDGIKGLIHRGRGKPSKRAWKENDRDTAMKLFKGEFSGFGPTYGSEKLFELHGIKISKETLRGYLIENGAWIPGKRRIEYRKRRERKSCFGIMIQLDGSPHDWFEGRAPKCTLLVFIDDATSKLVWLEFAPSESYDSLMKSTLKYFKKYGRPVSFYVDYGCVFSVNTNNPERDKLTQFERAMKEFSVEVIHARSPQAKGRVERVNRTLQDRLVKELRLANISSIEAANLFVQTNYIDKHNCQFAEIAAQPGNAHCSIDGFDVHNIFCLKESRVLQQDFTLSYHNRQLQLLREQRTIMRPRERILVHEHLDGAISLWLRNVKLNFEELKQRPTKIRNAVDYVRRFENIDEQKEPATPSAPLFGEMSGFRSQGDVYDPRPEPTPLL
jgi:hypothetical protein